MGAGILLSRILGLVRERAIAHFFGVGFHADIWRVATRMPNVVRYLIGEGTLSASMVPVYSRLLAEGRQEEARRFAGACLGILAALAGAIALLGVLLAPVIVQVFVPRWSPEKQEATSGLVRVIFPMVGVLTLSGWAMTVLDSHRRFFASYAGSSMWNLVIVVALVAGGIRFGLGQDDLLVVLAWAALAGGVVQFAVQGFAALKTAGGIDLSGGFRTEGVREAVGNFVPVVASRGAANIGGWIELFMVGLLAEGAASTLGYAQTLYLVPISLFGISIAAAELPELSRLNPESRTVLSDRVSRALTRLTRLTVPAVVGFLLLGDIVVAGMYRTGAFGRADTLVTWGVLAAYSLGIYASATSRTLSSTYYALGDARTPARIAALRVGISVAVGLPLMFLLDQRVVGDPGRTLGLGPVGIALGVSAAAWIERLLLNGPLVRRIGQHAVSRSAVVSSATAAVLAAALAMVLPMLAGRTVGEAAGWARALAAGGTVSTDPEAGLGPLPAALVTLVPYCALHLVFERLFGLGDSRPRAA